VRYCLYMTTLSFLRYAAIFALLAPGQSEAQPVSGKLMVAAASDLNFALEEVKREFIRANPRVEIGITYGSSGNLDSQIRNGAPFDVFLSADAAYTRRLESEGLAAKGSGFLYALGRAAVWVPAGSALDPARALTSPALRHLAIANPRHAPYGRAAEAALRSMGLYDKLAPKFVLGENISQTLQFVQSGAAEAGIIALSLVAAPAMRGEGRYWELPASSYPRLEQGGAVIRDSAAARAFCAYLRSAAGRAILKRYGFTEPASSK
jgi:molybdate transport system substrate-binding protein